MRAGATASCFARESTAVCYHAAAKRADRELFLREMRLQFACRAARLAQDRRINQCRRSLRERAFRLCILSIHRVVDEQRSRSER